MAQLATIGGAAAFGGVAGSLVPGVGFLLGAQIGFLGGSILAGILFPNEVDVGGPSRDDVRLSSAATGRFIPIPLIGSNRIGGQYRWLDVPFIKKTSKTEGGKGGGGTTVEGTKIFLTWNVGICEAPSAAGIKAITKIWLDDELIFDISEDNLTGPALLQAIATGEGLPSSVSFSDEGQMVSVESYGPIRIFLGAEGQPPEPLMQIDPRITEAMGSDAAQWISNANGLCHATFERIPGEQINGHFPQCEFEVLVDGTLSFEGIDYENVPRDAKGIRHVLPDGVTIVNNHGNPGTSDPDAGVFVWNLIDKNPETPIFKPYSDINGASPVQAFTTKAPLMPKNIGRAWLDPGLNILAQSGNLSLISLSLRDARQTSVVRTISLAGQPFAAYYFPEENPTRCILAGTTQSRMVSIPMSMPEDLNDFTPQTHQVPIPEIGIVETKVLGRPGFFGPDGLLYLNTGEIGGGRMAITAWDPFTLALVRAMLPYRESPDTDDDFENDLAMTYDRQHDKIILFGGGGKMRKVDRSTLTIEGDDLTGLNFTTSSTRNENTIKTGVVNGKIWVLRGPGDDYDEIDTVNMVITGRSFTNARTKYGISELENQNPYFDPLNQGLWVRAFFNQTYLAFLPLGRQGPICGTPEVIAKNISDRCDVPSILRQTSLWNNNLICGYMVGRRISGRKALEPIAGAINGDYRTQDGIVEFYINDTASIFTVPEDQLGYAEKIDAAHPRRDITWPYERELPYRIDMDFISREMDYAPDTQSFDRPQEGFRGRDRETIQMPIVFDTPSDPTPLEIVERLLYQFDINNESHALSLSWEYLRANVGDAISYIKGSRTHTVRIEKFALAENNRAVLLAKSEDISINTGSGEASSSGSLIFQRPTLDLAGGGEIFIFDVPLLRDQDEDSTSIILYIGISPTGTGENFKGGTLFRSCDDGATWDAVAGFDKDKVVAWGIAPTALDAGRAGVIDRTTQFTVEMQKGILPASVSEAEMDADDELHALAYGKDGRWEIMRYRFAVDSDGSPDESGDDYVLSYLRRGQANTENIMGTHVDGDFVVLLETANLVRLNLPITEIGVEYEYRFVPAGTSLDLALPIFFTPTGNSNKPAALVEVKGTRNISTGEWTITGCRGGRFGYDWVDFVTTVLGEETEEYEIDVLTGPGGTVIAGLSQTGLSTASATFTEADLVTYGLGIGGSPGESPFALTVQWYQISATVGRGQTNEVTVTSPTPGS